MLVIVIAALAFWHGQKESRGERSVLQACSSIERLKVEKDIQNSASELMDVCRTELSPIPL